MRKDTPPDFFPFDLRPVLHLSIAINPFRQGFVLYPEQPQLGELVEPLVGCTGDLVRGGEVDVAVVLVKIGEREAVGEGRWWG